MNPHAAAAAAAAYVAEEARLETPPVPEVLIVFRWRGSDYRLVLNPVAAPDEHNPINLETLRLDAAGAQSWNLTDEPRAVSRGVLLLLGKAEHRLASLREEYTASVEQQAENHRRALAAEQDRMTTQIVNVQNEAAAADRGRREEREAKERAEKLAASRKEQLESHFGQVDELRLQVDRLRLEIENRTRAYDAATAEFRRKLATARKGARR